MGRFKKGTSKARTQSLQKANATRTQAAEGRDKENVNPRISKVKVAERRFKAAEEENQVIREENRLLKKENDNLRRQLKNALAREKTHKLAKERWKVTHRRLLIDVRNAYASADRRVWEFVRQGVKQQEDFEKRLREASISLGNAQRNSDAFKQLTLKQKGDIVALHRALDILRKRVFRAQGL
ncbi:hypothetical protein VKT23_013060 [Stygiomarasmius scandens]|uniref:Uncharacterized protein n=1 Tax=Marasmiellus scandens TaxID=2682957 RepID=A0ABR1J4C3_9AGAR